MSEQNAENQTAAEVEAPQEPVAVEAAPEPAPVEWDNALANAFNKPEDASEAVVENPEAPFPSEGDKKTDTPAPEGEATPEAAKTEEEELPDVAEVLANEGAPANLSRKQLRAVEQEVLNPFRNPDVPISTVVEAFHKFHPTRTEEMIGVMVNEAVKAYPDEWLQAITGLSVTVDQVKSLVERGDAPAKTEQTSDTTTEEYLTELYGEDWKDASNDELLLDESDIKAARAARKVLELEQRVSAGQSELQAKLDKANKELEDLKPKIDQITKAQEQAFEKEKETLFNSAVSDYRQSIEQKALPKLFTESGLVANEQDTPSVKAVKDFVRARFEPSYGDASDFDMFVSHEFSGKGPLGQMVQRVSTYLQQSAEAEAKAKTLTGDKAKELQTKAQGLKAQAQSEQAALTVLTQKAAAEYLSSPQIKSLMDVLEENADLRRRFAKSGRPEIIGNTVTTANPDAWRDELKDKPDKWDLDIIASRLSANAR